LIDADVVPVVDSTAGASKKTTWANIKSVLKTYFDGIYVTVGGIPWSIATDDASLTINTGIIANKGTLLTLTLPSTAAVGAVVRVAGMNSGLWSIAQNANGIIHFGTSTTTTGATGYIRATSTHDSVELVCIVANNEWVVASSMGNITVA
jgi:hypothetical protein